MDVINVGNGDKLELESSVVNTKKKNSLNVISIFVVLLL